MTLKLGQKDVFSVLYRSIEKSPRLDGGMFKLMIQEKQLAHPCLSALRDRLLTSALRILEQERNINLQDHNSLKYSFMTLKLGQEEVYSVLYRFIETSPRSDIRLFKYDPGKATSPPRSEHAGGMPADSNCAAKIGTGEKH